MNYSIPHYNINRFASITDTRGLGLYVLFYLGLVFNVTKGLPLRPIRAALVRERAPPANLLFLRVWVPVKVSKRTKRRRT